MGAQYNGAGMYKRLYSVNDSVVEFTGEPQSVRKEVQYVANSIGGNESMADNEKKKPCCPQKVEILVQSEHAPFQEADREFLNGLDTEQIDKLIVMNDKVSLLSKKAEEKSVVTEPAPITNEQAIQVLQEQLRTPEQFIAMLPSDMRDTMTSAYQLHQAKRASMVTAIKAASRYTDEQLKSKNMDELEIIADMVKKNDYTGLGGGAPVVNAEPELLLPAGVTAEGGK
jgi:hypothetical protein